MPSPSILPGCTSVLLHYTSTALGTVSDKGMRLVLLAKLGEWVTLRVNHWWLTLLCGVACKQASCYKYLSIHPPTLHLRLNWGSDTSRQFIHVLNGQMSDSGDGWKNGRLGRWIDGRMQGQMDTSVGNDGWLNGWKKRWMDGLTDYEWIDRRWIDR